MSELLTLLGLDIYGFSVLVNVALGVLYIALMGLDTYVGDQRLLNLMLIIIVATNGCVIVKYSYSLTSVIMCTMVPHVFTLVTFPWGVKPIVTRIFRQYNKLVLQTGINGSLDKWWNSLTEEEKKSIKSHHTAPQ